MASSDGMFRLDGKMAVVTGGGQGIGEAICRRLAAAGARVGVLDQSEDAARQVGGAERAASLADGGHLGVLRRSAGHGEDLAREELVLGVADLLELEVVSVRIAVVRRAALDGRRR